MKRVRCPKCDSFIVFDETKYNEGQSLVFVCSGCKKEFRIRIGKSKMTNIHEERNIDENAYNKDYGSIIVVENKRQGRLRYILRDAPSDTGTFYMNQILKDSDRINLEDGAIITIGATTLILRAAQ